MPRAQFSIRTLLWITLVVAAFFTGVVGGNRRATSVINWERQFFRQRERQDRVKLAEKEQAIRELKEHIQAIENQSR